jgi:cytochrome c peroxidase
MPLTIRKIIVFAILSLMTSLLLSGCQSPSEPGLKDQELLGNALYFDTNLSNPPGQSCASCHDPAFGFADPDGDMSTSEGVHPGLFGNRNSPVSAYAMYAPVRHFDEADGLWIGGQFWDSRATGELLGDPLADQAIGPFENPVEMANTRAGVLQAIKSAGYYSTQFVPICSEINLEDPDAVEEAYHCAGLAIAAFERSALFAQFSSKYDYYLQICIAEGGELQDCAIGEGSAAQTASAKIFNRMEWFGMQLFMGKNDNDGTFEQGEGAMCSACHLAEWTAVEDYEQDVVVPEWAPEGWVPPMFTDFTYHNLGVPRNPDNPFYSLPAEYNPDGADFIDLGLGTVVEDEDEDGKFKVMTLRNISLSPPYSHNGFFKTLQEIMNFYNTRDILDWPAAEVPETINTVDLGNLGLIMREEHAIIMFMNTLTDGYQP